MSIEFRRILISLFFSVIETFQQHILNILRGKNDTVRYGLIGTYDLFVNHDGRFPSGDDDRSRVLDILTNRNQGPAPSSSFGEL